jgi:hypothetical protein
MPEGKQNKLKPKPRYFYVSRDPKIDPVVEKFAADQKREMPNALLMLVIDGLKYNKLLAEA